jgi:NAD(P)-dependent dehydrogenase (short-subunit alcohol dehydrogenase family)
MQGTGGGSFAGQVAVVTGAAQGLGFAVARLLAERCATVYLADVQENEVHAAAEMLRRDGLSVTPSHTDAGLSALRCVSGAPFSLPVLDVANASASRVIGGEARCASGPVKAAKSWGLQDKPRAGSSADVLVFAVHLAGHSRPPRPRGSSSATSNPTYLPSSLALHAEDRLVLVSGARRANSPYDGHAVIPAKPIAERR